MNLQLRIEDLKPGAFEEAHKAKRKVTFEDFSRFAQAAMILVGKALFYVPGARTGKWVHIPKD